MGILYLISTPIGNMEDISLRAIKTIGTVDVLLCEDTRHTGLLLQWILTNYALRISNYEFKKPKLLSYQEFNERRRIPEVIGLLKQGLNIGLVTDAGTPTISDPGFKLVREAIGEGIKVEAIPGASAILTALVSSGLATDKFTFLGYLPKKQGQRKKILESCKNAMQCMSTKTIIFFESPYRLIDSLNDIKEILGDIQIVICRELTKIHEEIFRGKVSEALTHFQNKSIKGELTIIINKNT